MTSSSTERSVTLVHELPGPPSAATAASDGDPVVQVASPIAKECTVVPTGTAGSEPVPLFRPSERNTTVLAGLAAGRPSTVFATVIAATKFVLPDATRVSTAAATCGPGGTSGWDPAIRGSRSSARASWLNATMPEFATGDRARAASALTARIAAFSHVRIESVAGDAVAVDAGAVGGAPRHVDDVQERRVLHGGRLADRGGALHRDGARGQDRAGCRDGDLDAERRPPGQRRPSRRRRATPRAGPRRRRGSWRCASRLLGSERTRSDAAPARARSDVPGPHPDRMRPTPAGTVPPGGRSRQGRPRSGGRPGTQRANDSRPGAARRRCARALLC
ncbi:MAG: hypothetical protein KatS3mg009_0167 [Acidimicrobiia bacterium]|nr:MAG: hypothetical protein KatS3mg009_0167 [Acidimicrobiia bacterium]